MEQQWGIFSFIPSPFGAAWGALPELLPTMACIVMAWGALPESLPTMGNDIDVIQRCNQRQLLESQWPIGRCGLLVIHHFDKHSLPLLTNQTQPHTLNLVDKPNTTKHCPPLLKSQKNNPPTGAAVLVAERKQTRQPSGSPTKRGAAADGWRPIGVAIRERYAKAHGLSSYQRACRTVEPTLFFFWSRCARPVHVAGPA